MNVSRAETTTVNKFAIILKVATTALVTMDSLTKVMEFVQVTLFYLKYIISPMWHVVFPSSISFFFATSIVIVCVNNLKRTADLVL